MKCNLADSTNYREMEKAQINSKKKKKKDQSREKDKLKITDHIQLQVKSQLMPRNYGCYLTGQHRLEPSTSMSLVPHNEHLLCATRSAGTGVTATSEQGCQVWQRKTWDLQLYLKIHMSACLSLNTLSMTLLCSSRVTGKGRGSCNFSGNPTHR